ncbi:MAG: hypothetical protein Q4E63_05335 [Prevotellaceae bacterium]|nr:hypothetical protein [Prevotellaceae bacterium]MDO4932061.1 hypothetical protein [Prevotellaceae bacterium]
MKKTIYLQTVVKTFNSNLSVNKHLFHYLCVGLFLVYSLCCFADEERKETVGNRTVTERNISEYSFYVYTIDVYENKAKNIKAIKKAYDEVGLATTPAWTNEPLRKQEAKKMAQFCENLFVNNKKGLTVKDMGIYIRTIIVDNGSVICTRIKSDVCLFDLYTPKEISDMFDKISTFKYSTPLVLNPKEGYYEADMCIWR